MVPIGREILGGFRGLAIANQTGKKAMFLTAVGVVLAEFPQLVQVVGRGRRFASFVGQRQHRQLERFAREENFTKLQGGVRVHVLANHGGKGGKAFPFFHFGQFEEPFAFTPQTVGFTGNPADSIS